MSILRVVDDKLRNGIEAAGYILAAGSCALISNGLFEQNYVLLGSAACTSLFSTVLHGFSERGRHTRISYEHTLNHISVKGRLEESFFDAEVVGHRLNAYCPLQGIYCAA